MKVKEEEIVELFFEVSKRSKYFPRGVTGNLDLYSGQSRCLSTLWSMGSMTQQEMADLLHIRSASLGESVQKLEAKGLVEKIPSKEDRRKRVISLTEEGRRQSEEASRRQYRMQSVMLTPLSEEEKEEFYRILRKIRQFYEELEAKEHV